MPVVTKLIDTSTCIGCKACEVACQEWNDLPPETTVQMGTYQTMPDMSANFWNLIKFREHEENGALQWLMRKDQCMHCAEPGCLAACPAPGAIVQYTNGIVDFQQDQCIGCGYCITGCPFDVPKIHTRTKRVYKCTLCVDRVAVGLQPACVKACPTSCLQFGTKDAMLDIATKRVDAAAGERVPERGRLRSARRRRHVGGDRARPRRPPRAIRPAARSVGATRGEALEGAAQVDREPGDAGWRARSVRASTFGRKLEVRATDQNGATKP